MGRGDRIIWRPGPGQPVIPAVGGYGVFFTNETITAAYGAFLARVTAVIVALHSVGVGRNLSRVPFFDFWAKKSPGLPGSFRRKLLLLR